MIIPDKDRDEIIRVSLDAMRFILAKVDDDMRRRMIASCVGMINAQARGDIEAADQYQRVTMLDLETVENISQAESWRLLKTILSIVASVAATQLPAVYGAIVGALAAFIGDDDAVS